MPYIKQEDRKQVDTQLGYLIDSVAEACNGKISALPGILNYCITSLIKATYRSVLRKNTLTYSDHNSAIGMLECCKMELYRRDVACYEDQKIIENGDV